LLIRGTLHSFPSNYPALRPAEPLLPKKPLPRERKEAGLDLPVFRGAKLKNVTGIQNDFGIIILPLLFYSITQLFGSLGNKNPEPLKFPSGPADR
jgi:hypothetical protein